MGRKRKDSEERMRALRDDPDYMALVESLKKLSPERRDQFLSELEDPGEFEEGEEL